MKITIEVELTYDQAYSSWVYQWRSPLLHSAICGGGPNNLAIYPAAGEAFAAVGQSIARMTLNKRLMELEAEQRCKNPSPARD